MKNIELLKNICNDIYDITGIKAVIYDGQMSWIYSHPLAMCDFCMKVRKHKSLAKKCLECDAAGFASSKRSGELNIYKCHMGLTEAVIPIFYSGEVIGFILFGQLIDEGAVEEIVGNIKGLKLSDEAELLEAITKMERTSHKIIHASARLMSMCASYAHFVKVLNLNRDSISVNIARFIEDNIKDVDIKMITDSYAISQGTLYNISKEAFGMGISDHIREQRLKRAISLIESGNMPIYRIAEEVGIGDANYLTKLIKKATGKTPRQIRAEAIL